MLRLTLASCLIAAAAAAASAADKAALVIDIVGDASPAVDPFSELEPGDGIELADDAELIIMHYATCEEIHMAGGAIQIGRDDVRIGGQAEVIARDKVACPTTVAFKEDANAAGAVVLRSAANAVIAPRPVFAAPGATRIEVSLDGAVIAVADVVGARALWPADAPDLMIGQSYVLRMTGPGGDKAAAATVRGNAGIAILRYE